MCASCVGGTPHIAIAARQKHHSALGGASLARQGKHHGSLNPLAEVSCCGFLENRSFNQLLQSRTGGRLAPLILIPTDKGEAGGFDSVSFPWKGKLTVGELQ